MSCSDRRPGLTSSGSQMWSQNSRGVLGVAGVGESFGLSLADANFGRDGHADLAVGVTQDSSQLTESGRWRREGSLPRLELARGLIPIE
jgi:hypothetical protein